MAKKKKQQKMDTIPAYPPEDYKSSIRAWTVALIERNLWDGAGWYGDVMIPIDV